MATYVLIQGGGTDAWYWHPLATELRARGHEVVAPDLPCDDESADLHTYTDTVVSAVGDRSNLIVVAHSLGGFTGPLVCDRLPVDLLVMLHAQIPAPGESPNEWVAATGYEQARQEQDAKDAEAGLSNDTIAFALHDTPPELAAEMMRHQRDQAAAPFSKPWPLPAFPTTSGGNPLRTRVLLARDDRFFPVDFMTRVAIDRLGITPDVMPGDHCPMLGHPKDLANRLESYRLAQ